MLDLSNLELDNDINTAVLSLLMMLYSHGIKEAHMGGVMRLLGVSNDLAAKHDDRYIPLDEDFAKYVEAITEPIPDGETIH
jgi:hypothetical protein